MRQMSSASLTSILRGIAFSIRQEGRDFARPSIPAMRGGQLLIARIAMGAKQTTTVVEVFIHPVAS
jgi:hypothetical protein